MSMEHWGISVGRPTAFMARKMRSRSYELISPRLRESTTQKKPAEGQGKAGARVRG
jgi:hypothetical protein